MLWCCVVQWFFFFCLRSFACVFFFFSFDSDSHLVVCGIFSYFLFLSFRFLKGLFALYFEVGSYFFIVLFPIGIGVQCCYVVFLVLRCLSGFYFCSSGVWFVYCELSLCHYFFVYVVCFFFLDRSFILLVFLMGVSFLSMVAAVCCCVLLMCLLSGTVVFSFVVFTMVVVFSFPHGCFRFFFSVIVFLISLAVTRQIVVVFGVGVDIKCLADCFVCLSFFFFFVSCCVSCLFFLVFYVCLFTFFFVDCFVVFQLLHCVLHSLDDPYCRWTIYWHSWSWVFVVDCCCVCFCAFASVFFSWRYFVVLFFSTIYSHVFLCMFFVFVSYAFSLL